MSRRHRHPDLDEPTSPAEIRRFLRPAPQSRTVTRRLDRRRRARRGGSRCLRLFGIEPNQAVLHQVVTAQLAAARSGTQSTKTRAEVRGGGAKPFRQKGTGRARQGSTRSPQWIGGGVALGPKPRSYAQKTPKKMIQLALRSALSDRAAQGGWPWSTSGPSRPRAPRRPSPRCRPWASPGGSWWSWATRTATPIARSATCPRSRPWWPASSTPTTSWSTTGWSSPTQTLPGQSQPGPARWRTIRGRCRRCRRTGPVADEARAQADDDSRPGR